MAGKRYVHLDFNQATPKKRVAPWILASAAIVLLAFSAHLALHAKSPAADPPPQPASISQDLPLPHVDSPAQQADRPRLELGAIESTSSVPAPPPAKTETQPAPAITEPLPPLERSDVWLRQQAAGLSTETHFQAWLRNEHLVHRLAVLVDNLEEGRLPSRLRAQLPKLGKPFPAKSLADDNRLYRLDPAGYQRYTPMIEAFAALDDNAVASLYQRSKPLIQAAFAELGDGSRDVDAAFFAVIDRLLAVSLPKGNIELVRPSVMYKFADPALEKRSAVDKLLIRMGPANAETLKNKLRRLRIALRQTATPAATPPPAPVQPAPPLPSTPPSEQIPLPLPPLSPLPAPAGENPIPPADKPKPRTIPILEALPPAKAGAAAGCCRH
ncbi:MAG: DUF3014 domain-containing protein [Methylococcaceae bacterium]|nr:MAG: DUF3014 domain-containing protein [Methylococcaceae bacterium]